VLWASWSFSLAHSDQNGMSYMRSCGVRRPSVRPSVRPSLNICANRFFSQTKELDRHKTCIEWSPRWSASRMCSRSRLRSKFTWYRHFCYFKKKQNRFFSQCLDREPSHSFTNRPSLSPFPFLLHPIPKWLWLCAVLTSWSSLSHCPLYSRVSCSVSPCAHSMKHHYTVFPDSVSGS